jgi:polyisoprenoid-binding protein YceI
MKTTSVHWSLKRMKTVKLLVLAAVLAISPACKKKDKADPNAGSGSANTVAAGSGSANTAAAGSGSANTAAGSANTAAGSGSADPAAGSANAAPPAPAEDKSDWIKVFATHVAPNPADPVEVNFEKFKVAKANFDPKKIEGGTATIEIDIASLKTSDAKRDDHLRTPDYLDAKQFTTATVEVANVKKKDDKNYTADAKVKFHGVDKTYPVTFEVVEATDDSIRIKAEHKFPRLDFKVGKVPNTETDMKKMDPKKDGVAADVTIKLQLTLKKT